MIGNGDVTTPQAAKKMFDETGCAGVSIGRGAFYNPWIFLHTAALLRRGRTSARAEFRRTRARHVPALGFDDRSVRRRTRLPDVPQNRPVVFQTIWPGQRIQQTHRATIDAKPSSTKSSTNYRRWRAQFLDESGELHSRYQPPPMVASFMQEPGVAQRESIPVPKGPVEVW